MAYSVLNFVAGLFNLAITSLLNSLKFFVEMRPAQSSEYLIGAAVIAALIGSAWFALRRPQRFSDFRLVLAAIAAVALVALLDRSIGAGMRGHYNRTPVAGAPFASAVGLSGFGAAAGAEHRNLMVVIVESLGQPVGNPGDGAAAVRPLPRARGDRSLRAQDRDDDLLQFDHRGRDPRAVRALGRLLRAARPQRRRLPARALARARASRPAPTTASPARFFDRDDLVSAYRLRAPRVRRRAGRRGAARMRRGVPRRLRPRRAARAGGAAQAGQAAAVRVLADAQFALAGAARPQPRRRALRAHLGRARTPNTR